MTEKNDKQTIKKTIKNGNTNGSGQQKTALRTM